MTTIGTLERVSAAALSKLILAEKEVAAGKPTIAIVDVRDDDYIGGHIKGCQNVPSRHFDAMLPMLVRQLQDKETVVFHCALSQQRGPSAALKYIRERERLMSSKARTSPETSEGESAAPVSESAEDGLEKTEDAAGQSSKIAKSEPVKQKVVVLDRGFVGWQEEYGTDERLTEGYSKILWQDGYWG